MWLRAYSSKDSVSQGKGGGQADGKRIVWLVVGRLYQRYVHSFEGGGERQGGPHIRQREGGAKLPDEGAFGLHAAVYPLCVVVAVVAAGHVFVHAALRHGFYRVHLKAFGGDAGSVGAHPGEFDGVAARS